MNLNIIQVSYIYLNLTDDSYLNVTHENTLAKA